MDLQLTKCKTCGEPLDITKAVNGVIRCLFCDSVHVLPKKEASPAVLNFLRMGEHDLDTCKFDEAYTAYKKAAELDPNEPEAYFGMALAEFKVQYLKDVSGEKPRLQPICHEVTDKKFSDNSNYMRAYMKATAEQRAEYERKAQEIDYILGEFYKLKQSGLDYDCFICVKVTDGDGKTEDSKDADYIYRLLQDKGYKPFYSEYEIRNKQGADYEAHILYALYTSECMLVVCRDESYLQTPWVKNEYTRFLKLVNDEEKESDSITFVYYDKVIERLPGRKGKLQGINFSRREADGQIVDFVESHTPEARKKREEAATAKSREAEEQKKRLAQMIEQQAQQQRAFEEQKRILEEQQRLLNEQLAKLQNASAVPAGDFSYDKLAESMERARIERERKEREEAERIAEAERKAREEAERIAREKAETERKAKEEAERIAREKAEAERKIREEKERIAREKAEAERKAREEAERIEQAKFMHIWNTAPTVDCYNKYEFNIVDKQLRSYTGNKSQVIIPDGVTRICESAFEDSYELTSIIIPSSVTTIDKYAFEGCNGLTNITIPNGVTSIGDAAFRSCGNLTSITIPKSVTSIGDYAIFNCPKLKKIYCEAIKKPASWSDDWYFGFTAKVVWGWLKKD